MSKPETEKRKILIADGSRILVRPAESTDIIRPIRKSRNKFAKATVTCPCCGATLFYADLCRQIYHKQKREEKYDRELLLTIIRESGKIRTGELARKYEQRKGSPIPNRMLTYIITDFAEQDVVKTKIVNEGRHGRTKIISCTTERAQH